MITTASPDYLLAHLRSDILMTCKSLSIITVTEFISLEMWVGLILLHFTWGHISGFDPFRPTWSKAHCHERGITCWDLTSSSPPKMCSADGPVCTPRTRVSANTPVIEVGAVSMKVFLQGSCFRAQQDMKEVIQTPFLLWRKITRSWINNSYCSSLVHTNQ